MKQPIAIGGITPISFFFPSEIALLEFMEMCKINSEVTIYVDRIGCMHLCGPIRGDICYFRVRPKRKPAG